MQNESGNKVLVECIANVWEKIKRTTALNIFCVDSSKIRKMERKHALTWIKFRTLVCTDYTGLAKGNREWWLFQSETNYTHLIHIDNIGCCCLIIAIIIKSSTWRKGLKNII